MSEQTFGLGTSSRRGRLTSLIAMVAMVYQCGRHNHQEEQRKGPSRLGAHIASITQARIMIGSIVTVQPWRKATFAIEAGETLGTTPNWTDGLRTARRLASKQSADQVRV